MLVRKDQLVQKELLELKAQSDLRDLPDQLDRKGQRVQQEVVVVEVLEHQDRQVQLDQRDHLVRLDQKVTPVQREQLVQRDRKDCKVQQEQLVPLV